VNKSSQNMGQRGGIVSRISREEGEKEKKREVTTKNTGTSCKSCIDRGTKERLEEETLRKKQSETGTSYCKIRIEGTGAKKNQFKSGESQGKTGPF